MTCFFVSFLCLCMFSVAPEPQAKMSVHIEEVPKDLEEQVEDLHAQVCFFLTKSLFPGQMIIDNY